MFYNCGPWYALGLFMFCFLGRLKGILILAAWLIG